MEAKRISFLFSGIVSLVACTTSNNHQPEFPNIVLIYADDLGYGDVSCYNENSKIPTPNIDKLAGEGVLFTNAHAPATQCSPSRYGILTGQYHWRTDRRSNPLPGEQTWLESDRITLAKMLTSKGYDAAAIGKWGLAADWQKAAKPGRIGIDLSPEAIDYSKKIPVAEPFGFNYDFLHLWFSQRYHITTYHWDAFGNYQDGGRWNFENGFSVGGAPVFSEFDMREAQVDFGQKAVDYIKAKGGKLDYPAFNQKDGAPFFLYYSPHIPHSPVVPHETFQGKTDAGDYGDFIFQMDYIVGMIVESLKETGQYDNTIIIFTSDNGPENWAYERIQQFDHSSMGNYRGVKRDLWEAGHRVPFIISYPAAFDKGVHSDQLISQTDILTTLAEIVDYQIPDGQDKDSRSFLPVLKGPVNYSGQRESIIYHGSNEEYAMQEGDWVFINYHTGESNIVEPEWFRSDRKMHEVDTVGFLLYNIKKDPYQTKNVISDFPEIASRMKAKLENELKDTKWKP
jgi:arylsulfatase A